MRTSSDADLATNGLYFGNHKTQICGSFKDTYSSDTRNSLENFKLIEEYLYDTVWFKGLVTPIESIGAKSNSHYCT
jgi:hypothetical protein